MKNNSDIMVSVCCIAYNQEKYITKCIEGFLMQKTDFKFEVIIHSDASTDKTSDVILEYQKKHPEIIKAIIQKENQFKTLGISGIYREHIYPIASGKYFAYCEGDDFWSDPEKLQKQVDALEKHKNCHICLHRAVVTDETGKPADWGYPLYNIDTGIIDSYDFLKKLTDGYFFHTTSFLCRSEDVRQLVKESPDFYQISDVDDVPLLIYFGQLGKVYYINETLTSYRRNSIGSWTENQKNNLSRIINHKLRMINLYNMYEKYTKGRYTKITEHWINNERFMIAEYEHDYREMSKKKYKEFLINRSFKFRLKVKILGLLPRKVVKIISS